KPQTTRHTILGIKTLDQVQMIFVDTPGIHQGVEKAINRVMNKAATSALDDVDIILFVVEKTQWTAEDQNVLKYLERAQAPILVLINKTDQVENKQNLIPHLQL